jgi:hypothetical protein
MIELSIKSQLQELSELTNQLSNKNIGIVTSRAINRSLVSSKGMLKRAVQQQFNISSSELKSMPVFRSSWQNLTGKVGVSRKPIGLSHFNPVFYSASSSGVDKVSVARTRDGLKKSVRTVKRSGKKGVSFEIKKGERVNLPYAFITKNDVEKPVFARGRYVNSGGNYDFVLRRERAQETGSDMPITKLLTTSVYGAVQNNKANEQISIDVSDYFSRRLLHELKFQIQKIK